MRRTYKNEKSAPLHGKIAARAAVRAEQQVSYMRIEYDPPKKKQPFFAIVKGLLRIFVRKVRVVVLGEELGGPCVYLANHANKMGPMIYSMFFPEYYVSWGASPMLGSYSQRYRYLRDVLYMQKNGARRGVASFRAFFEAFFSPFVYRGIKVLPTYTDGRLIRTIKKSADILAMGIPLMIFPEHSEDGYKDELTSFFSGFCLAARYYNKTYGADIPIRPVYYHKRRRIMVVGETYRLSDFPSAKKEEIAKFFLNKVNKLYHKIVSGEIR